MSVAAAAKKNLTLRAAGWSCSEAAALEQALADIEGCERWPETVRGLRGMHDERRLRPMPLAFRLGTAAGMALGPVIFLRRSATVGLRDPLRRRVHTAAILFHEYQHIVQYRAGRHLLREGVLAYLLGCRGAHRRLELEPYRGELHFVCHWTEREPAGPLRDVLDALRGGLEAKVRALQAY